MGYIYIYIYIYTYIIIIIYAYIYIHTYIYIYIINYICPIIIGVLGMRIGIHLRMNIVKWVKDGLRELMPLILWNPFNPFYRIPP